MKKIYCHLMLFITFYSFSQDVEITGPVGSGSFGERVTVLTNGNFVVVDVHYDEGATTDVGAVYLYNGATKALISTLKGSVSGDQIGSGGVFTLSNGNFIVSSGQWSNGSNYRAGAVTWVDGVTGLSGVVSSSNSLVGSVEYDDVGVVKTLSNGNYVVFSPGWDNGGVINAGAVTLCNGSTGTSGLVSSSNSLVGSSENDNIGNQYSYFIELTNGNFVVNSPNWDNGAVIDAGASTWVNATTGITGVVSSSNSLVGSNANDNIGKEFKALTNGNYVVYSNYCDFNSVADCGAVTWVNGGVGITGLITSSNSLLGSSGNDLDGVKVTPLTNGNYVVTSPYWDDNLIDDVGAATWGNGTTGVSGFISGTNSLIGSTSNDEVGNRGVFALSNGNYIVGSTKWDDGSVLNAGAVTWGNGTSGITGVVSISNSLVGSSQNDFLGSSLSYALTNGNYVVCSEFWDNGGVSDVGAVTWGNGTSGTVGYVTSSNSVIGSTSQDKIGNYGAWPLTNGNYVIRSYNFANGSIANAGAVTWCNGASATSMVVSSLNSLVGGRELDFVGDGGVVALTNGNYVVSSRSWANGSNVRAGAATWGDGTTGVSGLISASNSLIGVSAYDQISSGGIEKLSNGNYFVNSLDFDYNSLSNAGAVTFGSGTTGITGVVTSNNSLVGSSANDLLGLSGQNEVLSNGNFIIKCGNYDNGNVSNAGAVLLVSGVTGLTGEINNCVAFIGSTINNIFGSKFNSVNDYNIILKNNNAITLSNKLSSTAKVSIISTDVDNSICEGESVTFTATPINGGTPVYEWKNGNTIVGTNSNTFVTSALASNNSISVNMSSSIENCTTKSNSIITLVNSASVLSFNPASRCGTGNITISATPSAGTIKWYDQATGGNEIIHDGSSIIISGNNLTINNLASTTTYYAEATNGTCASARTPVTASVYNCTKLLPQDCGATLEELNEILYYSSVANASNYEYWVEGPNGYSQTKLRGSNKVTMDMSWFPNLLMEATYTVKIRAFVDGVWQDYGDACNITTPKTKLRIGSCGLELTTWNKVLYYSAVYNATDYEYLVEGPNGYSQTKTRGTNKITMDISWFTGLLANATYTVKIRARVGGNWGDYGDACTITTPETTNLISGSCGRILTALNKPLYYTEVYGATNYEYLVEGPNGYSQTHIRGNNKLTMDMTWLHNAQALTPSTIYTVKIRALVGGNWQDYGSACDITTPASLGLVVQNSGAEMDKFETIALTAYPNPSNGEFTISSSHEGTFNIINELGQLVQTVEITKENNYQVHVGVNSGHALNQQLQPGIYFITGTINNEVITNKIVVQ